MAAPRARRTRPRRFLTPVAATLLALSSIVASPGSSVAVPVFGDGFESGDLSNWTTVSSLTVQQGTVFAGSWAARAAGTGGVSNATRSLASPQTELTVRSRFFVTARITAVWLQSFRTSSNGAVSLVGLSASGKLQVRNAATSVTIVSPVAVSNGAWHEIALHTVTGSSGMIDVSLDGMAVPALTFAGNVSGPIARVMLGESASGRTYDVSFDEVSATTADGVPDITSPTVPTNLVASAHGPSQIQLTWTASNDDVGVAGYTVYRSTGGALFTTVGSSIGPSFPDTGLAAETTYTYVVDAFDAVQNRSGQSSPASATTGQLGQTPPNVVLIVSDDQPADTIAQMPTLQSELVGKGVSFPNGVVTNPLCCPSRASIQRGQYSHTTGVYGNASPFGGYSTFRSGGLQNSTIATWLDGAGFRTGFIGKYMNGAGASERPPGWDHWRGATAGYYNYKVNENGIVRSFGSSAADYSTSVFSSYADAFIRSTSTDTPLFLMVDPYAPHSSYTPAPAYAADPRCANVTNSTDPSFNEADVSDKPAYIRNKALVSAQSVGTDRRRAECRTLLSVDDLIATVLQALAETGRLGDTLLVYTSDNGSADGEHRWNYKMVPYEGSLRVPFIVRYDPLTGGQPRVDSHLVANVDLAPTILDLLDIAVAPGCPTPPYGGSCSGGFDGESFLADLDGSATPSREPLLLEHYDSGNAVPPYCGIRTATHKFVRYTTGEQEMYDLIADPSELSNMLRDGSVTPADQALRDGFMSQLFGVGGMCLPPPPTYALP